MSKILVVEDEIGIGMAMRLLLETEGLSAVLAENGLAAIEHLKSSPPPALIVLDLRMPVMNGWELLGQLRAHADWSRIPVLITSAEATDGHQALPMLPKPFNADQLLSMVRQHMTCTGCSALN